MFLEGDYPKNEKLLRCLEWREERGSAWSAAADLGVLDTELCTVSFLASEARGRRNLQLSLTRRGELMELEDLLTLFFISCLIL